MKTRREKWFWAWTVLMTQKKKDKGRATARTEVWENLILVTATSAEEAYRKACEVGKAEEGDCHGTLTLDGAPAITTFLGLFDMGVVHDKIGDGAEITWRLKRCTRTTAKKRVKRPTALLREVSRELGWGRNTSPLDAQAIGKLI